MAAPTASPPSNQTIPLYAAVTSSYDGGGVQIISLADPTDPVPAGSISGTGSLVLHGAISITTFESNNTLYAAVASRDDSGVQIISLADPNNPAPAGSISDTDSLVLGGAASITTFKSGTTTYAAVASSYEGGVQILSLADPTNPVPAGSISDTNSLVLGGAAGITTFKSGTTTYAAVTSSGEGGVQILNINHSPSVNAGPDQAVSEDYTVTLSGTASDQDNDRLTYLWTYNSTALDIVFSNATSPSTTFTAPQIDADTDIIFTLNVTDGTVHVADTVTVTIRNVYTVDSFITTWQTDYVNQTITLPLEGSSMTIYWGDGHTDTNISGTAHHTYANPGNHTVSVSDGLTRFHLNNSTDAPNLASIDQWGNASWTTMEGAFWGATNMVYNAADAPDLNGVTDMSSMFSGASSFNGDLASWTVSSVTDMSSMFSGASSFNQPLASWNVSSVTGMDRMFSGASSFRQNLGNWYVVLDDVTVSILGGSTVIRAQNDFLDDHDSTYAINDTRFSISETSNRLNLNSADIPLGKYNVTITASGPSLFGTDNSRVVEITINDDEFRPFITTWKTTTPNQQVAIPVGTSSAYYTVDWGDGTVDRDVRGRQVHSYSDAGEYTVLLYNGFERLDMFKDRTNAAKLVSINQWGETRWTTMENAFWQANEMVYRATDIPDLTRVKNMRNAFIGASAFNGNISGWDVSSVTEMVGMFSDASSFNRPLDLWEVSSVTGMGHMFFRASSFNQTLDRWDVSSVTGMGYMFGDATSFNRPLASWNVSQVTEMGHMFDDATSFNQPLDRWNVSQVTNMGSMFDDATSFNRPLASWNVSQVTDMDYMFFGATSFNRPLASWNVSQVTDMDYMFSGATSFNGSISNWNVSSITDMNNMFSGATSFNQPLDRWDVSSVIDMDSMFFRASSFNQPLASWNVSSVTDMDYMFSGATSFNQTLNAWNVSSVTDMRFMFENARAFNQPLNNWNVSSVERMSNMLVGASSFNQPLNAWDVSSVTDMRFMFQNARAFNQPLNNWNVSSVEQMDSMFSSANSFVQNLGNWYIVLDGDTIRERTDALGISTQNSYLDGQAPVYSIAETPDDDAFFRMVNRTHLAVNTDQSVPRGLHDVTILSNGGFGTDNFKNVVINVDGDFVHPSQTLSIDSSSPTSAASITVKVDFDEAVNTTTFAISDISVTGGSASSLAHQSGNRNFTFVLTPTSDGEVIVSIPASQVVDLAGNVNTASNTLRVTFDRTPPMITLVGDSMLPVIVNSTYVDPGASCTDNIDGDLTGSMTNSSDVDTAVLGQYAFTYTCIDAAGNSAQQSRTVMVNAAPPVNTAPTVNAGTDQEVVEGATVTLSGTATDGDPEDALTYEWTHDDSLAITFATPAALSTTFAAPDVAANTTVTVTLTVNDGTVDVTDTLQVTITDSPNRPPTVNAGTDQEVVEGATVTLSGTATDGDPEDALTYEWTHDDSLAITITDSDSLSASFAAPDVAANTTVTVTLTVNDGTVDVADTLQVTITDSPNRPPTVNAGTDQGVVEGATVTLSGTATDGDPEDALTYEWTHDDSLAITFATPAALSTTFAAPDVAANTTVTVTLTVNDGTVDVADTLQVTITDSPNRPPTVNAGTDQGVVEGATVTLSGTATDGDPEDALTYEWTHDDSLAITFATPAALSTTFAAPDVAANTTVTVTLTVNDGTVDVADTLQVTITDSPNRPPTVNAGTDQGVVEGATVTLSGTATDGDPEDALTYEWTHDDSLAITFATPAALSTTFAAPDVAANTTVTVTLTVNDGTVDVADTLQVTITDSPNRPPTVNAGTDQGVVEGATVTLSGTATDGDPEDALTYEWTHDDSLAITITDSDSLSASFAAPDVAANTTVTVTLTVNDGTVDVADTLQVTITDSPNRPPTVNAGTDQGVVEGATVTLSGTATDGDPEDALTYEWTHDDSLAITITDSDSLSASFAAPDVAANTTVTVTLTVNDGTVDVADTLQVTITDSPNRPPTVNAGTDQGVVEGATVTLSGTATDGDPEDALTYEWTHDDSLAITITDSDSLSASFAAPDVAANTTVTVTLTVNDGTVDVADTLQVTITDSPNRPPTVNAGTDQGVVEGATVTLSGTATDGDPEDALTYEWTHDDSLAITFATPARAVRPRLRRPT